MHSCLLLFPKITFFPNKIQIFASWSKSWNRNPDGYGICEKVIKPISFPSINVSCKMNFWLFNFIIIMQQANMWSQNIKVGQISFISCPLVQQHPLITMDEWSKKMFSSCFVIQIISPRVYDCYPIILFPRMCWLHHPVKNEKSPCKRKVYSYVIHFNANNWRSLTSVTDPYVRSATTA